MPTPHNAAGNGDFAKTVLMPGDPLRAQFVAKNFLEAPRQVTGVRGMLGYTGTYAGKRVSVMGSGMGMPSIGIYSYELYTQYDVDNIIRIGSAGSYSESAKVFDVMLALSAYSESSYARVQSGYEKDVTYPSAVLNDRLRKSAAGIPVPLIEGTVHSSDVFYREDKTPYWQMLRDKKGCLAVEMESFALFHNAAVTGKNAACLLTVSDSFVSQERITAEQRETSFTSMIRVALGSLLV
ncbi:MAG: purine-nucleoside phosphorylase [Ruthenibacterium sp.]